MYFLEDFHDVTLVRRAQNGNMDALEQLVQRYQRVLYTVALGMLGDPGEAREATRAALLSTYARLSMPDRDCGFFSAMHRLLICECLDVLRDRPSQPADRPSQPGRVPIVRDAAHDTRPIGSVTLGERRRQIQAALLQLTPESRAVVVLRHLAGLSYEETAITLGLPADAVRWRLHAARQQLGERLLAWPRHTTLRAEEEALLQGAIDGVLDPYECDARNRLVLENPAAPARAAALRELGHLLNSLGPADPPIDLAIQVLSQIAVLTRPH